MTFVNPHILIKIDFYIRNQAPTGSPEQLANKIGISQRSLFDYMAIMRQWGADVKYSRKKKTFCYLNPGQFKFGFYPDTQ